MIAEFETLPSSDLRRDTALHYAILVTNSLQNGKNWAFSNIVGLSLYGLLTYGCYIMNLWSQYFGRGGKTRM
jgi:hypothetical protein